MNRVAWAPPRMGGTAFLPAVRLSGTPQPRVGMGSYTLGQTAQEWYERAKAAIARYEFLTKKVDSIDNKIERENILTWIGDPQVPGTPAYRYATVKSDFIQDVAREGVGAYNVSRRQNRVRELEEFNDQFEDRVDQALEIHGVRQPGETRIETREVESPLTTPILIGAGVVAVGIIAAAVL